MNIKDKYRIGLVIFILINLILILNAVLPKDNGTGKYIDDKKAGVVWILNDKGDTLGTVQ